MARSRTAFLSGTITNDPLAAGGTTLNSAGLSSLPTIASPDIAALVLDPTGSAGAPEVVYVTAHTASATSATISRGNEGSTDRQHASGTAWVHGPTMKDFPYNEGSEIASATTIVLPADESADLFELTGSTTVATISGGWAGRKVTFYSLPNHADVVLFSGGNIRGANDYSTSSDTTDVQIGSRTTTLSAGESVTFVYSDESSKWELLAHSGTRWLRGATVSSVTMTNADTYYDGASITLPNTGAGIWLINGWVTVLPGAEANIITSALHNGSTQIVTATNGNGRCQTFLSYLSAGTVVGSTWKIQSKSNSTGASLVDSFIWAVRLN